jgi:hypothetical protein
MTPARVAQARSRRFDRWLCLFVGCALVVSCKTYPPGSRAHPLATFYLDYAQFDQGYFNSGLLEGGSILIFYADAQSQGKKPLVIKIVPALDASMWTTPEPLTQKMTAQAGGSLQVDPSVIDKTWQAGIKASVLRETTLDLEDAKKYQLRDPARVLTDVINDSKYVGEFRGYTNAARYTILFVDSYVDASQFTVSAGEDPKANRISVTWFGKQPVSVDISNLHSVEAKGSKLLFGLKTYTLKKNEDGALDVVEDRRNRVWSDAFAASSPF